MKELQELFNHMYDQHGLILLESEMFDIIDIVNRVQDRIQDENSNWCKGCNEVFSTELIDGLCKSCKIDRK